MEVEEEMRERFKKNLPEFSKKLNPTEVIQYLDCLLDQNTDTIINCQNNRSRSEAVFILYGHLIRKKNGCRQLVAALRDVKQPELANLLDPQVSSECNRECQPNQQEKIDRKQEAGVDSSRHPGVDHHVKRSCDGNTLVRDLNAKVLNVYRLLDCEGLNNWEKFAVNLDIYTAQEVVDFRNKRSPGRAVISDWVQKTNPNLETLMMVLNDIERKDMIDELQKITKYRCPDLANAAANVPTEQETSLHTHRKFVEYEEERPKVTIHTNNNNNSMSKLDDEQDKFQSTHDSERNNLQPILNGKCLASFNGDEVIKTFGRDEYQLSRNADSSIEVDGPMSTEEAEQSPEFVRRKLRYKWSENGNLAMTANDNTMCNGESVQKAEIESVPIDRHQAFVQEESRENYRVPVQTEPSMASDQFINLKQERLSQVVRPRNTQQRLAVIQTGQELDQLQGLHQPGISLESYMKLHTEQAPTLSNVAVTDEAMETFQERETSSLSVVSDTATDCNASISLVANVDHSDPDDLFQSLCLSSITSDSSVSESRDTCQQNFIRTESNNSLEDNTSFTSKSISGSKTYISSMSEPRETSEVPVDENDEPGSQSYLRNLGIGIGLAAFSVFMLAYRKLK